MFTSPFLSFLINKQDATQYWCYNQLLSRKWFCKEEFNPCDRENERHCAVTAAAAAVFVWLILLVLYEHDHKLRQTCSNEMLVLRQTDVGVWPGLWSRPFVVRSMWSGVSHLQMVPCSLVEPVRHESQLFLFLLPSFYCHLSSVLLCISHLNLTHLFYPIARIKGKNESLLPVFWLSSHSGFGGVFLFCELEMKQTYIKT